MTKVKEMLVKCKKCGKESKQIIVFSANYMLGSKKDNDRLIKHEQVCPFCKYTNFDISK